MTTDWRALCADLLTEIDSGRTERDKARAHFGALKTYLEAHLIHLTAND